MNVLIMQIEVFFSVLGEKGIFHSIYHLCMAKEHKKCCNADKSI